MPTVITMTGPGTTTVNLDPVAAAITTANTLTIKELVAIQAACNEINKAVREMKNNAGVSSKAVKDLQIAVASIATATSAQTVIQAAAASNQIKTNNFQVQATKDALERTGQPLPKEPSVKDQITETVKDSMTMNGIAVAEGAVTNYIGTQVTAIATLIAGTETYKTIAKYLETAKDTVLNAILPPSASDVKSAATGAAGIPDPSPK